MDINAIPDSTGKQASEKLNLSALAYETTNAEGQAVLRIDVPLSIGAEYVHASSTDKAVPMITVVPKSADPNHVGQLYFDTKITQGDVSIDRKIRVGAFNLFIPVPKKK
jgi:hypothetical protein